MRHHDQLTTIAILGADTVVGRALCALLEGFGYQITPLDSYSTGVVDDLHELLHSPCKLLPPFSERSLLRAAARRRMFWSGYAPSTSSKTRRTSGCGTATFRTSLRDSTSRCLEEATSSTLPTRALHSDATVLRH